MIDNETLGILKEIIKSLTLINKETKSTHHLLKVLLQKGVITDKDYSDIYKAGEEKN